MKDFNLIYRDKTSGTNILGRRIEDCRRYELQDGREYAESTLKKYFSYCGKVKFEKDHLPPPFNPTLPEEWRKFPLNPEYTVSSYGKILNANGVKLKCSYTHGYRQLSLRIGAKFKSCQIHRVVALTFIPNPKNLSDVNHMDGVRDNNNVENLEWVTRSENVLHAVNVLGKIKGKRKPKK